MHSFENSDPDLWKGMVSENGIYQTPANAAGFIDIKIQVGDFFKADLNSKMSNWKMLDIKVAMKKNIINLFQFVLVFSILSFLVVPPLLCKEIVVLFAIIFARKIKLTKKH
jgi:hypothetical protein